MEIKKIKKLIIGDHNKNNKGRNLEIIQIKILLRLNLMFLIQKLKDQNPKHAINILRIRSLLLKYSKLLLSQKRS